MYKKTLVLIKYFFSTTIWLFSFFSIRKNNIWVFGYGDCQSFTDNSKYLFLHTHNTEPDVRCVWITKNKDLIENLNSNGYECYYYYSPRGIYITLLSKWGFVTHNRTDIPWWVTGGMNIVRLNHGLPFKKFGWAEKDHIKSKSKLNQVYKKYISDNYTYSISTSEYYSAIFSEALNLSQQDIWITGYPRMDTLVNKVEDESIYTTSTRIKNNGQNIFYFPTWRRNKQYPDINTLDELNHILKKEEAHLYCKFHPFVDEFNCGDYENITFFDKKKDFYPVLRDIDYFITDYSSLFYDPLFNQTNLIFFAPDLKEYLSNRELYFDYDELPGEIIKSPSEIRDLLTHYDSDDKIVKRWTSRTFYHNDGKSSERIIKRVKMLNSNQD